MNHTLTRLAILAALGLASTACSGDDGAPDDGDEEAAASSDALRTGEITVARPEVGYMQINLARGGNEYCTATLIAPRLLLSAAHCVDFKTKQPDGRLAGVFVVTKLVNGTVSQSRYKVDGYRNLGRPINDAADIDTDLALVHLIDAVPAAVASPAALATARPATGTGAVLYGFGNTGCTATKDGVDDHKKRRIGFAIGTNPRALCPGDSGGPVLAGGKIFAVASGSYQNGADYFAHPYNHMAAIVDQAARWNWGR